jgi:F-type H+-transporting ATPase subunit gamma
MGGLKEVRERITSVSSTRQITSAMKMVSAAKLRRAQDAITRMRPYASKLKEILENLSATVDLSEGGLYAYRARSEDRAVGGHFVQSWACAEVSTPTSAKQS